MALESIQFFGAVDRKGRQKDGMIASSMPAWYFDTRIEDLQGRIDQRESQIKRGGVTPSELPIAQKMLEKDKLRMLEIQNSKPKVGPGDKDELAKMYDHFAKEIGASMPSRTEMRKGLVSAHEEARRMKNPIISVDAFGKVLSNMGIRPHGKKISRDEASKVFKLAGKLLQRDTNTEYLRRDYKHGTYQGERSLDEMTGPER